MMPRITVITLGVDDLERALKFYRDRLGLPTRGIVGTEFEHGAVAFFDLQHGLKFAIWPRTSLAHEAKVSLGPRSATECTLGHNVASKAEVDAVMGRQEKRARRSPIRRTMHSGAATPARYKTPMDMSGKWPRILIGSFPISHKSVSQRADSEILFSRGNASRYEAWG
jgi:uncharacterized protein